MNSQEFDFKPILCFMILMIRTECDNGSVFSMCSFIYSSFGSNSKYLLNYFFLKCLIYVCISRCCLCFFFLCVYFSNWKHFKFKIYINQNLMFLSKTFSCYHFSKSMSSHIFSNKYSIKILSKFSHYYISFIF